MLVEVGAGDIGVLREAVSWRLGAWGNYWWWVIIATGRMRG